MATAPVLGSLFLSPVQAGELLGCSDATVLKMCREGQLGFEKRGRNFKIPRVEVERLAGVKLGPSASELQRRELYHRLIELQAEQVAVVAKLARLES